MIRWRIYENGNERVKIWFNPYSNGDINFNNITHAFTTTGAASKSDGSTAWGIISDRRVKTDINTYTYGLE